MDNDSNVVEPKKAPLPAPSEPLPPHPAFAPVIKITRSHTWLWVILIIILLAGGGYSVYYWQHQKVTDGQTQLTTAENYINNLNNQVVLLQKQVKASGVSSASAEAKQVAWTSLDSGLQQAITARWQIVSHGYTSQSASACQQPQTQTYLLENDQFASATIGCTNPETDFLVKVSSDWRLVSHGPGNIECSTILQYSIPTEFVTGSSSKLTSCVMPDGSLQQLGTAV